MQEPLKGYDKKGKTHHTATDGEKRDLTAVTAPCGCSEGDAVKSERKKMV